MCDIKDRQKAANELTWLSCYFLLAVATFRVRHIMLVNLTIMLFSVTLKI